MIKRYTKDEMAVVWTDQAKFGLWVQSLLAKLYTCWQSGRITAEEYDRISQSVTFDVARVHELDKQFNHDAQALIEAARESLRSANIPEELITHLGMKVTSYDMEDPAFSRMICNALDLLDQAIDQAIEVLLSRVNEFRNTECIFITHGQPATPGYFSLKICRWTSMLQRDKKRIALARKEMEVGKFSGATGVYDETEPEEEIMACAQLGLEVADGASQIIHRDRHAFVMSVLSICGSNLAQIANDLWLMCAYPRCEAREYFSSTQRGSSAMPHKRNPITVERVRGMASLLRGYLVAALEQVVTFDERAIDQSSVERVIWPDATILLHYMLTTFTVMFKKMVFFPIKMKKNLDSLQCIWAAQYVKNALLDNGIDELKFDGETQPTYKYAQSCAFIAWDQQANEPVKPLYDVFIEQNILNYLAREEYDRCFDVNYILRNADTVYARFGL